MKISFKKIVILTIFNVSMLPFCNADPAAVYFDPGMTHEVLGVNRYPTDAKEWSCDLHLSPFYQHASGARGSDGKKVPIGDRLGRWEMFGILWGNMNAAPPEKPYTKANYDQLYTVSTEATKAGASPDLSSGKYDPDGDYSVPVHYEKIGFRCELDLAMASGFGLTIKSGVVDFRQTPSFNNVSKTTDEVFKKFLDEWLMTRETRDKMLERDLGFDLKRYQTVAFEDTFAQIYWSNPFKYNDAQGNHVVTVSPYLGAGVWIPTGKKKNQDKMFALPTGHDGFWGVSFEGALNFDFPETVLINIGGGVIFFETKTLHGQRVPNHPLQATLYPWKATIQKTYGPAWNINASLKAKNIIEHMSVYFDYLYCRHERDTITMREADSSRNQYFYPQMLEEDSWWKSQMVQLGFQYQLTPDLAFGVSGQTHISGVRVYKTHTIMGTVTFTF